MSDREQMTVAMLTRRHGAWMIQYVGEGTDDWTTDELVDCAASLAVAKRLARQDLRERRDSGGLPFSSAQWVEDGSGGWDLVALYDWSKVEAIDDYAGGQNSADHGGSGSPW